MIYTPTTPLLHTTPAKPTQALALLWTKQPNANYSQDALRLILSYYVREGNKAGVDWLLLWAQGAHETDYWRSWWSARPRRNPAGIGVNGRKDYRTTYPTDISGDWHHNPTAQPPVWEMGYAFPDWLSSVRAHIGHVLAYMYTDTALLPVHRAYVEADPRAGAIPADKRGSVRAVVDLSTKWAPSPAYHERIITIANAVLAQGG